jgi:hypothetical protein
MIKSRTMANDERGDTKRDVSSDDGHGEEVDG